jgi:hypothetical protein
MQESSMTINDPVLPQKKDHALLIVKSITSNQWKTIGFPFLHIIAKHQAKM